MKTHFWNLYILIRLFKCFFLHLSVFEMFIYFLQTLKICFYFIDEFFNETYNFFILQ